MENLDRVNEQKFSDAELAEMWDVSPMTLARWRKSGRLRYYKLGHRIYYAAHHLEQFLVENEKGVSAKVAAATPGR